MPRASTKVFKKRRGVFNKGRCNKSNDGCGESNSTVPKNSADEKNCADGAKLCTNETESSASERKIATRETCEHSMAEAVHEAVDEMMEKGILAVAVDGSWQNYPQKFSSVKDMQQAIWAIFLHKLSTDEKPQHGFCPSDTDTWCKFKRQNCLGDLSSQKNSLPVDVVEAMRPVFRDLANPELLKSVYMETDHQIGTSVHAPQRPMVTCIMMGTVVPGTYGFLCH
ncbi:uncharacterized protein TNCV_3084151 [Trichonephila clavipes]|nr:uncharacterized protein TNCV_3084151 [Trichonephila clavipes]